MQQFIGKKVLVTTNNWFTAPDGCDYKCVYGTLKAIHEAGKSLGFIPNRSHANWFIEIGKMVIMGCQVMYIIECETINQGETKSWHLEVGKIYEYTKPTTVFVTE